MVSTGARAFAKAAQSIEVLPEMLVMLGFRGVVTAKA
jgi:hypothetical protein